MAEAAVFETQERKPGSSADARRLRRQGLVPGVVYGHKEETIPVSLPAEELEKALRHGTRVMDIKVRGKVEKTLVREIQWDHLGKELLHVDFGRVSADERVTVTVPLVIRGTAPGIAAGGVLDQPLHAISVECLVTAVPESIRVNVGELQLGQVIHLKELALPPGVVAKGDPETVVVHVTLKQVEPAPGAAPAVPTAEQAEPEIIGRKEKAAEEEEAE